MNACSLDCFPLEVNSVASEDIYLFEVVMHEAQAVGSLFRNTLRGRDALLVFLDMNNWFGVSHSGIGNEVRISTLEPMKDALDLWLRAYGRSQEEKVDLLLETYASVFPQTCRMFRKFVQQTDCKRQDSTWKVLDFILATLYCDISAYDESCIRAFIMQANQELNISAMKQLVSFLNMARKEHWEYQFQSRQVVKPENGAYSVDQFSIMAYIVFNETAWREHGLVDKAAEKRKYAELWLFTALHFVCAARKTDLVRLPVPSLPYAPLELRERIAQGQFTRTEARAISEELVFRLEMKPLKPNKTSHSGNVPNIKLFIPESILEPFGLILALALSWREPKDPFVSTNAEPPDIQAFFGEEFAAAAGKKRFLSRRATKAYLQGIELTADNGVGANAKGYMLAALARSHKGGIGKPSEITDVYLKDANFSGYSPEFILREMFERGIFGFIPALLLESYAGEAYRRLDIASQTKLIQALGLDAMQLENITTSVTKSFRKAEGIVRSLLIKQDEHPRPLEDVLQNIAAGAAPSKQSELLCLRVAAGYPCCAMERTGCIGCGYEIYTKSAMHLLMKEYVRMNQNMDGASEFQRRRMAGLLEDGILPAITEIVTSIPMLYPNAEMEPLYQIMERGLGDADHSSN